jgi:hypothetical protein
MRTSGYSRSLSVLWTIRAFAVGFKPSDQT